MANLKALRSEIEKKLQELMKTRGWDGGDSSWYTTYRKGSVALDVRVDSTGDYTVTGYQIVFYSYCTYNRRFKVTIDRDSFAIDEKKLDRKIEEVCAILRERDEAYRKSERRTEERETKAVEFAAEIDNLLPGYRIEGVSPGTANLFVDSEAVISITKVQLCMFHLTVKYPLIASERTLAKLVETLTDHT